MSKPKFLDFYHQLRLHINKIKQPFTYSLPILTYGSRVFALNGFWHKGWAVLKISSTVFTVKNYRGTGYTAGLILW